MCDQHKARVRARKKSALLNRAHDSHDSEWWATNWPSSHPSYASACAACGVRAVGSSRACWLRGVRRSMSWRRVARCGRRGPRAARRCGARCSARLGRAASRSPRRSTIWRGSGRRQSCAPRRCASHFRSPHRSSTNLGN